ncbi:hypothetical protein E3N88_00541 [Mikania micrantha]|uniref:Uncharacterized protein n=1 Tax=Mikania micrantha TaxID=192012 RepID=A0A5N6PYE9_9ASTR|nr:hypothetical protein E3N88_00541 [Mikania micrantha]
MAQAMGGARGHIVQSSLPGISVEISLDRLYFCVEGDESFVWAKESLKSDEKRVRYAWWKFNNGGGG